MSAASFWLMGTTHCNSTVSLPTAMRSSASLSPRNSSMRMAFAVHFSGASGLAPSRAAVRRRPCSRCCGRSGRTDMRTPGPRFPRPGLLPAPSSIRREPLRSRGEGGIAPRSRSGRAGRWRPAGKSRFQCAPGPVAPSSRSGTPASTMLAGSGPARACASDPGTGLLPARTRYGAALPSLITFRYCEPGPGHASAGSRRARRHGSRATSASGGRGNSTG